MDQEIEKIFYAAEKGGQVLLKYFGRPLEKRQKSTPADFVTKADLESEEAIIAQISQDFPDFNILSEEREYIDKKSEYTFIIDPLDGSNNFIIGIPQFSVAIALLKGEEAIAAAIFHPILEHRYYARKGSGAYFNEEEMAVNTENSLEKSTISYVDTYTGSREYIHKVEGNLMKRNVKRILRNWSVALDFGLLARGCLEAIINKDNEIYDYIAGKLIAKEAGAKVTDFQGNDEKNEKNRQFIISNGTKIHEELLNVV